MARKTAFLNDLPRNAPGPAMIPTVPPAPVAEPKHSGWQFSGFTGQEHERLVSGFFVQHNGKPIAEIETMNGDEEESRAFAELFVSALRAYDRDQQTIRELTEALDTVQFLCSIKETRDAAGLIADIESEIRAALAKAKESN